MAFLAWEGIAKYSGRQVFLGEILVNRISCTTALFALGMVSVDAVHAQAPGELPAHAVIRVASEDGFAVSDAFFPLNAQRGDEFTVEIRVDNEAIFG